MIVQVGDLVFAVFAYDCFNLRMQINRDKRFDGFNGPLPLDAKIFN